MLCQTQLKLGRLGGGWQMLRKNPRHEASCSPACPIPQPCLCSRNPGHTQECIIGSDHSHGQEGSRSSGGALGASAGVLPVRSALGSTGVQAPNRAALLVCRGPSAHTRTTCLPGPMAGEGQRRASNTNPEGLRGGGVRGWEPEEEKQEKNPGSPCSAPAAEPAPLATASPDPKRQQQWKEGHLEHESTLRFHSQRGAAPP